MLASGGVLPTGPTTHGRVPAPSEEPALPLPSPWPHLAMEGTDLSLAYVGAVLGKTQSRGPELYPEAFLLSTGHWMFEATGESRIAC